MYMQATKVGPFGSGGGYNQDIDSDKLPATLKKVEIWSTNGSGGLINAISFTYDTAGNDDTMSAIWGTDKGIHNRVCMCTCGVNMVLVEAMTACLQMSATFSLDLYLDFHPFTCVCDQTVRQV